MATMAFNKDSLMSAIRDERIEDAQSIILDFGLSKEQYTTLRDAARLEKGGIHELLLTNALTNTERRGIFVNTSLHYAAMHGDIDIAETLLNSGANIDAVNHKKETALHVAAEHKHTDMIKLLLKYGADVSAKGTNNIEENGAPVDISLDNGAPVDVSLDNGAPVDISLNNGAPVDISLDNGAPVDISLGNGAPVDISLDNDAPVDISLKNGAPVDILLENGAPVDISLDNGAPVDISLDNGAPVDISLANDAPVDISLNNGAPVDISLDNGAPVDISLGNGAPVDISLDNGAPVDISLDNGAPVDILLENGAPVDISLDNGAPVDISLDNGAPVDISLDNGAPVDISLDNGAPVDISLDNGASVTFQNQSSSLTPLMVAVVNNQLGVIKSLVEFGANVNAADSKGKTALHLATDVDVIDYLVKCGADVNARTTKTQSAPLHFAKTYEVVKALIDHGAQVNLKKSNGNTALNKAVLFKRKDAVKALLEAGADVNLRNEYWETPLQSAIYKGDMAMVRLLLESRRPKIESDYELLRALIEAGVKDNVVPFLLNNGVNINALGINGNALNIAIDNNQEELFRTLLKNGVDANVRNESGYTPLLYCLIGDSDDGSYISDLLKYGANVNLKTENGQNPLHFWSNMSLEAYKEVLNAGADVNCVDMLSQTPLHSAALHGAYDVSLILLDYGADVNLVDNAGKTPLALTIDEYPSLTRAFIRSMVQRSHFNYVSEKNIEISTSQTATEKYYKQCLEEMPKLREKINNTNVSLYDFMVKNEYTAAKYFKNHEVVRGLKVPASYRGSFPVYGGQVEQGITAGRLRRNLLDRAYKILQFFWDHFPQLPPDCAQQILENFPNDYLKVLIDSDAYLRNKRLSAPPLKKSKCDDSEASCSRKSFMPAKVRSIKCRKNYCKVTYH